MERLLRRSRAAGLRWFAFSVVGLGVVAACSDEPAATSDNPNSAGEGGRSDGGGAAAAGEPARAGAGAGGAATLSGGAGGAAAGEAGAGGVGGEGGVPPVLTLGEQCAACGATECADTLASCSDGAACGAWLSCLTACATEPCVAACDERHAEAARVYAGVYACLCTSCENDCSPVGACDKTTCVDADPVPPTATAPATLAETGLFATVDGSGGAGGAAGLDLAMPFSLAPYVRSFEPKYPLWSDGALKERYVYLPACAAIDTTDMDHWKFPVGTRFWKTFKVAGGGVGAVPAAVETRFLHRFGPGALDWTYAAYQWDVSKPGDPTAARLVSDLGLKDANGTSHDIPSVGQCKQCHNGLEEKVLGFGAIQLSHDGAAQDLTIKRISELGWLTTPAPDGFQAPGDAVQQAALGYLHGNCGGCHSEKTPIPNGSPQLLRLMVGQTTYATNDAVTTTVNAPIVSGLADVVGLDRIEPMEPTKSGLLIRMEKRAPAGLQMPPIGTEVPDSDGGVKAVTDWIMSIPKPTQ